MCLPPWMKLRPLHAPDSRVTGARPGQAGGPGAGERAQFGHVDDQSRGGDARDAGDGGEYPGSAPQGFLALKQPLDLVVDALQLALDLRQPLLVDPLRQGVAQVLAAVEGGGSIRDQRVAHRLQFGEVALAPGFRRGRAQVVDRGRHDGQRPSVHGVGLRALPPRPGEAPDLVRIDRVERKSGLQQHLLEVAVPGPAGLVGDAPNPGADPGDQFPEPGRVVREAGRPAPGGRVFVGVEPGFRDVDPDGMVGHLPFSRACHASLDARVSIRDVGKDGGGQTARRPLMAKPVTVRPPPPFGAPAGARRAGASLGPGPQTNRQARGAAGPATGRVPTGTRCVGLRSCMARIVVSCCSVPLVGEIAVLRRRGAARGSWSRRGPPPR